MMIHSEEKSIRHQDRLLSWISQSRLDLDKIVSRLDLNP